MNKIAFRTLLLITCLTISIISKASESDSSSNIVSYYHDLNFRVLINTKFNNLILSNNSLPRDIQWKTNENNLIGIGVNYKWFGLNLLFNIPSFNNDDLIYGKTSSINLIGFAYGKNFGLDLWVQENTGFYLEKPNIWYPNWSDTLPYPINSNLKSGSFGANFIYVSESQNFSLKANFVNNERQKRSSGSPIAGLFINGFTIQSDSSLLPLNNVSLEQSTLDIKNAFYLNIGSLIGYSHTFIWNKYYFLSLTGGLGLSLQASDITTFDPIYNNKDENNLNAKILLRGSIGYSNDDYFVALSLLSDNNRLGKSLNYNFGIARLTLGYRIKHKKRKPD